MSTAREERLARRNRARDRMAEPVGRGPPAPEGGGPPAPGGGGPPAPVGGGPPAPVGVAPPPAIPITFCSDPYQSDFNPSDSVGSKLWINATKALDSDKQIKVTQANATKFMDLVKTDSRKFYWSPLINLIQNGTATRRKILEDFDQITLLDVQKQARQIWNNQNANYDDPMPEEFTITDLPNIAGDDAQRRQFFLRMRSRMIASRLEGVISSESHKSLMLRKKEFTWTDPNDGHPIFDGPTMLKILVQSINPTTRVGVSDYKERISSARMNKFNHDLIKMLDEMESNYNKILELGQQHEDWTLHVFNAMISAKNRVFTDYIQRKKDEWEVGEEVNVDTLINDAKSKYNNMVKQRLWDKQDPNDAKIATLTTELTELKQCVLATSQLTNGGGGGSDATKTKSDNKKKSSNIDKWRTIKKGDHKKVDGVDYWWCPDHKWEGHFDGLYVTHKPGAEHEEWKKKRDEKRATYKRKKRDKAKDTTTASSSNNDNSLSFSNKMKAAMVTNFQISAEEADELYSAVLENSSGKV